MGVFAAPRFVKYARFRVYQTLLPPVQQWARRRRMNKLVRRVGLREGMRVLDLGGQPHIWQLVDPRLRITILNLPREAVRVASSHHELEYVEGDATRVEGLDQEPFDLVFSNSVIEHVGDESKQAAFAREVRRLGRAYWVQTPAPSCPIEPHTGMPWWWFYPARVQRFFIAGWYRKLPAWTAMILGTRVLSKGELRRLFPDSEIETESILGIPKSYVAYRPPDLPG